MTKQLRLAVSIAVVALAAVAAFAFRARIKAWFAPPEAHERTELPPDVDYYTCPMHPSVHEKHPGQCPICGMTLVPVTKQQQREGVIRIGEERRQEIGVRTAKVVTAPMQRRVRAIGRVTYDERGLADVNLKVKGWIQKLWANETGQRVSRGQPLFSVYSPELYNAEKDYLLALPSKTAPAEPALRFPGLAPAARERLLLLGMTSAQVDALAQRGSASEDVVFTAPASGVVVEKNVVEGGAVEPGMRVMRIAALDRVWVEADVYESDLPTVKVGAPATVTLDYVPGRTFDAKVTYVYPYLDTAARTGRVRLVLQNHDLALKPGMYANVELAQDLGPKLEVPVGAIVYTGPRRLVFLDLGEGKLKPQVITTGVESDGKVEVLSGLKEGDVVVTSGVFLVASEARIATATKYWEPSP